MLGGVGSGKLSVGSCEMMLIEVVEGAGGGSGAGVYGFRRLQGRAAGSSPGGSPRPACLILSLRCFLTTDI